ncbi:MAG TPA: hypothetical protein VHQ03_03600, partial [Candidatus Dormibacteraeota bacterium]|nr:hypothetical protein [Candidatus Dormibacteraeota bacterium]
HPTAVKAISPPAGIISTFAGPNAANLALTVAQTPAGLAVFGSTLYVSDAQAGRLYAMNTTTDVETLVASGLGAPHGLAVDSGGNVYVAAGDRIDKVSPLGAVSLVAGGGSSTADGVPAKSAQLYPQGVAIDSAGNVLIADSGHNKIREVDHSTGNITTIAGNGTAGFSGDGGPATSAELYGPADVVLDGSGNVWIADTVTQRIREVDHATGFINTMAGNGSYSAPQCHSGPALTTALADPYGIWVSGSDVFIADHYALCVQRLSAGTISVFAGTGGTGQYAGDGGPATSAALVPEYVTGDGVGNVYISDDNSRVRKVSAAGTITTVAGTGDSAQFPNVCLWNGDGNLATLVPLCSPTGEAFDASGNLYVAENGANAVREITPAGVISTVAGNGFGVNTVDGSQGDGLLATRAYVTPSSLAIAGNGDIFIAESWPGKIRRIDHATGIISTYAGCGCVQSFADGIPAINASFQELGGIALDATGDLFVADGFNQRIRKIDTTSNHIITTVAGGGFNTADGISANQAQLGQPIDVAIDSSGDILIADNSTGKVRKVAGGIITTLALINPNGVSMGPGDRVVATTGHQVDVISTFSPNRIAGTGASGFSGDGGPAISAQLNRPVKVAFDPSGNMYIDDTYNGRIREVTAYSAPGPATSVAASPAAHAAVVTWTPPANLGGTAGIVAYEVIPYQGATPLTPVWVQGAP